MALASCTGFISSLTQTQFRRFFSWLGIQIYRKPWLFILIGALLTLSCSVGFLFFDQETRGVYLWIPQRSEPWSQYVTIIDRFGSYPRKMLLLLTVEDQLDSILSPSNMDIAHDIFNDIDNIALKYKGDTYNFNDLCLRPYPIAPFCTSQYSNIFGFFFNSNSELWQNNTMIEDTINVNNSAIKGFAGGLQTDSTGYVNGAKALLFIYELEGSTNQTVNDITKEYMRLFIDYWEIHATDYPGITIQYLADGSWDDEVSRVVDGDIPVFGGALLAMFLYLLFTLGDFSCIRARPWLACSSMLVMLCAMAMGFGISFFCGTQFNTVVSLAPYILLGVGVDDMIILVDTYQRTKLSHVIVNQEMRLAKALSSSGLSISLTSFCSSMAFFVGSTTDVPVISAFCMFSAWSFLANYILQFLIFVPLMVYDDRRILKQNNFCCPCCIHHESVHAKDVAETDLKNKKGCKSKLRMEYFMTQCVMPILSKKIIRWLLIIVFCAVAGASVYGALNITTESDDSKIVPDDSYILPYMEASAASFGESKIHDLNIVIENEDISRKDVRDDLYALFDALEGEPDAIGKVQQWLTPFTDWVQMNKNITNLDGLSRTMFYNYLQQFANDTVYTAWDSEIIYNDFNNPTEIKATRFLLTALRSSSDSKNYDEYLRWNQVCDENVGSHAFVYELEHGFSFLSATILQFTVENMFFAALGVFAVLLLLLDCRMALFILIIVAMIDIDLFGWMYILDISLDVVSYTELVMAVGLTVDYVIHISHAITEEMGGLEEVNDVIYIERLKLAMTDMGTSVLKGAFTTFLGVVALAFSQSEAFRIFFYMFLGIIIIAVAHGILLVPALLGEFKFIYKGMKHSSDDDIPFEMEKHQNLSTNGAVELTDYDSKESKESELMEQLLNLKQRHKNQYMRFEKDLDVIIENVSQLKNENVLLKKENLNLRNGSNDVLNDVLNDGMENELNGTTKAEEKERLEVEIMNTLDEKQKSKVEKNGDITPNIDSIDEVMTGNDISENSDKSKNDIDIDINEMASMLKEISDANDDFNK